MPPAAAPHLSKRLESIVLLSGPVFFLISLWGLQALGLPKEAAATAGVAVWCIIWWVFESVPVAVTAMVPLALLPITDVLTTAQVGQSYGSKLVLLLLGGFILSRALECSGAHWRIAISILNGLGGNSPRRLVLGFMLVCALLSMWVANAATALMLLPVALAVIKSTNDGSIKIPLLLGIAYGTTIGGMGTPIGNPPNLVFMEIYKEYTGLEVSFSQWMKWTLPIIIILIPVTGMWITRNLGKELSVELPTVGAWSKEEKRVMFVFVFTALAWVLHREPFGGWSQWLGWEKPDDATVALCASIALFMIPNGKGGRLLTWEEATKIPWGILILVGGGICLAKGFVESGLSNILGELLVGLTSLPVLFMLLILTVVVSFLTETTSNTATTTILMPILAAAAISAEINPLILMLPAVLSASCAFMLPIATGPNMIVYSTKSFSIKQMAREGFILNIFGAVIISLICWKLLPAL